ncbi:MAG: GlsB/YeaQ/YmgE family stress response membrane protein [Acidimicrobiales bacterium]
MLIIGIVVGGMAVGALAQLLLGRAGTRIDWTMALVSGLAGSFIGGLIVSLLAGDGLALKPSGIIGSLLGAVLTTMIWIRLDPVKADEARQSHPRRSG